MSADDLPNGPPVKRRKADLQFASDDDDHMSRLPHAQDTDVPSRPSKSLDRTISPPLSRRQRSRTPLQSTSSTPQVEIDAHVNKQELPSTVGVTSTGRQERTTRYISSPIRLTQIKDLPAHSNTDCVRLQDILGDALIKECWNFNYLFDLDFVMEHLDPDVRHLVKMKIIHGFWKKEDERRIRLMQAAEINPNIELISAYIPDPFGTHHSKMMILFRHDDTAQVIIHTANMIAKDWTNMTQAVWQSPLLPLQPSMSQPPEEQPEHGSPIGTGQRFKTDLLRYLKAYGKRLEKLYAQLEKYNFSSVHAAFIGSTPSRQKPNDAKPKTRTSFGWPGLEEILSTVPVQMNTTSTTLPANIVVQVSSIATLGQNTRWLDGLSSTLSRCLITDTSILSRDQRSRTTNFFTKASLKPRISKGPNPTINIIFPTAEEIRTSLDGYAAGASIHTKIQSPAQQKQLEYLRPLFCHWKTFDASAPKREAYRGFAAPHIKTYIRFSDIARKSIDWAMLTSANLSKQAWGEMKNQKEEVWIQSWETGVVVWPKLFDASDNTTMVPVFGKDIPSDFIEAEEDVKCKTIVGIRMPYDLPLVRYEADEVPWCATLAHEEPDWKGCMWHM